MQRFWNKVDITDPADCWNWKGATRHTGHGTLSIEGHRKQAHRIAYELCKGHSPDPYIVSQTCGNKLCVNPAHLVLETPEYRFWQKAGQRKPNDCWEWIAAKTWDGYGEFCFNGKVVKAHRFSYSLVNGPIPAGMLICHHCDNPSCVNPAHLFIGTDKDNNLDKISKGRDMPLRGSQNGNAKLDEQSVKEIKQCLAISMTQREIATKFNVSKGTIYYIAKGIYWKHVTL